MSAMLKRIDVVVLFVEDLDRTKAFYRDTLELPMKFEDADSAMFDFENTSIIVLSIGGAQDLLSDEAVAAPPFHGARSQLVAFVDDVDAVYKELTARGVEFIRKPEDRSWGMRTAHFTDPDGNVWEISRPLTPASDQE
jgi:lactoylglutathione lyase